MAKSITSCSIDEDLKKQAKNKGLILSHLLEMAIKSELDPDREMERLQCRKKELLMEVEDVEKKMENLNTKIVNGEFVEVDNTEAIKNAITMCVEGYERLGQVPTRTIKQQAKNVGISESEMKKLMFVKLNEKVEHDDLDGAF